MSLKQAISPDQEKYKTNCANAHKYISVNRQYFVFLIPPRASHTGGIVLSSDMKLAAYFVWAEELFCFRDYMKGRCRLDHGRHTRRKNWSIPDLI